MLSNLTFKNIVMDLIVWKKDLARKDTSNKLMIFVSDRKKWRNYTGQQKKVMSKKNQGLQHKGGESGSRHSWTIELGNDKNNVIAGKVLHYF